MIVTLFKHGDNLALVIDKSILETLRITADTPLELSVNGESIVVRPIRDTRRESRLQASLETINQKFGDDLRRLAE